MQRRERTRIEQVVERRRLQGRAQGSSATEFFDVSISPELLDLTDAHPPEHRERLHPPTVTLSMFLRQTLAADPSCQQAVNAWTVSRAADGLSAQSVRTGGYCRARARLPLPMVQALTRESGRARSARPPRAWGWQGRIGPTGTASWASRARCCRACAAAICCSRMRFTRTTSWSDS
jgi:hypothetical protein